MRRVHVRRSAQTLSLGAIAVLAGCLGAGVEAGEASDVQRQGKALLVLNPKLPIIKIPPLIAPYPWLPKASTDISCMWVGQGMPSQFSYNPAWIQPNLHLYGTDLGYSFTHKGSSYVLFGDTWPLPGNGSDDAIASIVSLAYTCPPLRFEHAGTAGGNDLAPMQLFAPAPVALGALKTPLSVVSSGPEAYAFFSNGPKTCTTAAQCQSGESCFGNENGKSCWTLDGSSLGYPKVAPAIIGKVRVLPGSEFDAVGTVAAQEFANLAARAVPHFDPSNPSLNKYEVDFTKDLNIQGTRPAILVWGKPAFGTLGPTAPATYLMYFDLTLPISQRFRPYYFTGMSGGIPQWSSAAPGSATLPGIAPVVTSAQEKLSGRAITYPAQMSMSYVPSLGYWVMLYGGRPALVPGGAPADDTGYGIYMRTAYHPWGPWSPAKIMWRATDSAYDTWMFHPARNPSYFDKEFQNGRDRNLTEDYGAEYGAAILEPMTTSSGPGKATIHWALSTWNPYRVLMMQTELQK